MLTTRWYYHLKKHVSIIPNKNLVTLCETFNLFGNTKEWIVIYGNTNKKLLPVTRKVNNTDIFCLVIPKKKTSKDGNTIQCIYECFDSVTDLVLPRSELKILSVIPIMMFIIEQTKMVIPLKGFPKV